jgi:hypothetical protein
MLCEIVAYLATRGHVEVVVPVPEHLAAEFEAAKRDPAFADVVWHTLAEHKAPGLRGAAARMLKAAPVEVAKYAVEANRLVLERCRAALEPTVELAISSWALAAYRDFALPKDARLYMFNVDPRIVTYFGPSLKRKVATLVDRPKVARLCRRAVTMAGRVGAISAADVADLDRIGRRHDVTYVPPLMRPRPLDRSRSEPFTVLITTNFTYPPNVVSLEAFLRDSWPLVDARARLTVTGKDEAGALAALCGRHPRVTYAGCVSASELDERFARTAVAVNPTRVGSGFQVKLLDALARSVPVVSTQFSNRIGPAVPSSDDPKMLAALIDERLVPGRTDVFDYDAFYRAAVAAWDAYLVDV